MGKYQNPEISQRTTLLQAQPSDQQNQELLKQIQRRASLPYDPSMDRAEKRFDTVAERKYDEMADAFDLEMGPKLEATMTTEAKQMYNAYREREAKRNIIRERLKADAGIGLPTL